MKATTRQASMIARRLRRHVDNLILATALAEARRQQVDPIRREVLANYDYRCNHKLGQKLNDHGERITDPDDLYLCEDDCSPYYQELHERYVAMGFELPEVRHCPALMAEHVQRLAEWALIEAAEQFFPVTNDQLLCGTKTKGGPETRREYLDLLVKLVVNAPGYRKPEIGHSTAIANGPES
jgi:hypothetical protein